MREKAFSILLSLAFASSFSSISAQSTVHDQGQIVNLMESSPLLARETGLGGSTIADPQESRSLNGNPANLAGGIRTSLLLQHYSHLFGVNQETMIISFPAPIVGIVSIGMRQMFSGSIPGYDEFGTATGDYNTSRSVYSFGISRSFLENVSLGVRGNFIQTKLDQTKYHSISGDAGVLWKTPFGLDWGASLLNMGTYVADYLNASEIRTGIGWRKNWSPKQFSRLYAAFSHQNYGDQRLHFGVEHNPISFVFLRLGYSFVMNTAEQAGAEGLSFGCGIEPRQNLHLDYAGTSYAVFEIRHLVSLRWDLTTPSPGAIHPTPAVKSSTTPTTAVSVSVASNSVTVLAQSPENSNPLLQTALSPVIGNKNPMEIYFESPNPETQPTGRTIDTTLEDLLKMIESQPQDPQAWYDLGKYHYSKANAPQAIQCFEQVLRLRPDNKALFNWLIVYKNAHARKAE